MSPTLLTASCPKCQTVSHQGHGYYTRTVQDLNWSTYSVQLELHRRRFICTNTTCSQRTFTGPLDEQIPPYARRTTRCKTTLQAIGLALGGNAGVRLAQVLGLSVSADTLLRLLRFVKIPERKTLARAWRGRFRAAQRKAIWHDPGRFATLMSSRSLT